MIDKRLHTPRNVPHVPHVPLSGENEWYVAGQKCSESGTYGTYGTLPEVCDPLTSDRFSQESDVAADEYDGIDPAEIPACPKCGELCDTLSLVDSWHCSKCELGRGEKTDHWLADAARIRTGGTTSLTNRLNSDRHD